MTPRGLPALAVAVYAGGIVAMVAATLYRINADVPNAATRADAEAWRRFNADIEAAKARDELCFAFDGPFIVMTWRKTIDGCRYQDAPNGGNPMPVDGLHADGQNVGGR